MSDPKARLQVLSEQFTKLQTDLQSQISSRQTLSSQQQENLSVQSEFSTLQPHNTIYKMVGPVLMKQSHEDAKMAVESRLGYIEGEIGRVEERIAELQEKGEKTRGEIVGLQIQIEGSAAGGGGGATKAVAAGSG